MQLWKEERKGRPARKPWDLRKDTVVSVLQCLFAFFIPDSAEDASHLEMATDTNQMNPHKNLLSLVKVLGNRQPSMTKSFWMITTLLQPTAQENLWPIPTSRNCVESLDFNFWEAVMRHLHVLLGSSVREGQVMSCPTPTHPHPWQWRPCKRAQTTTPPGS